MGTPMMAAVQRKTVNGTIWSLGKKGIVLRGLAVAAGSITASELGELGDI